MRNTNLNSNAVQMAAENCQMANGNKHLAIGKSLLASGCLQSSVGRKILDSRADKRSQARINRTPTR